MRYTIPKCFLQKGGGGVLQLILGLSGTGKTGRVVTEMKVRAAAGLSSILLVPEQFSSSAETMVYKALGDRLSAYAEVYSFTSFAEYLLKTFGGVAVPTLTDAARAVAVRRAMDALGEEVKLYYKNRRSTGFCNLAAQAIQELKTAGAAPGHLLDAAAAAGADGEKLRELGLIFAAYEDVIAGSAMDPADRLSTAAARLPEGWLADKAVYIDNFDGFTAPQYDLLRKLVHAEPCVVTLCCDGLTDTEAGLGLFSPVKKTAQRLRRLAGREGAAVGQPKVLAEDLRHRRAPALRAVNEALALGEVRTPQEPLAGLSTEGTGFWLTPARGLYDECKRVACRIAALVREGYHYNDIAVICRLMDDYQEAVRYEFGLADIPYFTDETDTLEHTAPVALCTAALTLLARGLATEPLLRLLKTDLCGYDAGQIAALENYAYTWQLSAAGWRQPFRNNPAGFGAELRDEDQQALAAAEALRGEVVPKVEAFLRAAKGQTAGGVSEQLYRLMTAFGADKHIEENAARLTKEGDALRARALYSTWNNLMDLFGQMEKLLGGDEVTAAEYLELFLLLVRSADIGHVPETQDAVMLTTADRMRLSGPKVCFVVGAEEGKFPKLAGASGLLTHADRDLLVQNGVQMPGSYENRTLLEQMFFYRALTAAGQRLYVSFTAPEHGGAAVTSALLPAAGALSPGPDELTPAQWAPTPAAALDLYGQRYREDTPEVSALAAALARDGTMAESLAAMDAAAHPAPFAARDAAALDVLLGTQMLLSPTRLEQYYRCRFSYFLQYELHIRPRKKAELSPLESGSLIHYILENAMRRAGARFPTMDKEELAALAGAIADDYVAQNMPQASARFAYLIGRLKRSVTNLLYYLQEEQAQSSFHPVAYEQEIGPGGIPPLTVETPDGKTVQVVGKIDRVDVMQRDGRDYLRVVDYKTGSKTFSLDEVYCGLNTQMLLYLFTLCHAPGALCENPVAAGVLYLAGDPPPKSATRATAAPAPLYKVDGMVLDDEVVLRGMDKAASGLFVPCTFGKDGRRRASAKLASLEKLGNIEKHITGLVLQMARGLYAGEIAASPLRTAAACPCDVCDYRPVCRHEDGVGEVPVTAPKNVFETLPQEGEDV